MKKKIETVKLLKPLYTDDYRVYIVHGGRASGKSWGVAQYIAIQAMQGKYILCTRENATSIDSSSKKLIEDTIDRMGLADFFHCTADHTLHPDSGGKIIYRGMKGGSKFETKTRLKSTEGVDICWIEEAQALSIENIIDLDPTIRGIGSDGQKRRLIFTLNPYSMPDPVFQYYEKMPDVCKIEINLSDNPFAPIDQVAASESMKESDPVLWDHIYGGKPMSIGNRSIVSISQYNEATTRKWDGSTREVIGADIARFGDDMTIFVKRRGNAIIDVKKIKHSDLINTADELMRFGRGIPARVDDTGLGGGVTDYLRRKGYPCQPINFAESALDKSKYADIISEMWFMFADKIDKVSLPLDNDMRYQLTTRQYNYDSYGRRRVESKADYKKRAGKSPDIADAVLLAFYDTDRKPLHYTF